MKREKTVGGNRNKYAGCKIPGTIGFSKRAKRFWRGVITDDRKLAYLCYVLETLIRRYHAEVKASRKALEEYVATRNIPEDLLAEAFAKRVTKSKKQLFSPEFRVEMVRLRRLMTPKAFRKVRKEFGVTINRVRLWEASYKQRGLDAFRINNEKIGSAVSKPNFVLNAEQTKIAEEYMNKICLRDKQLQFNKDHQVRMELLNEPDKIEAINPEGPGYLTKDERPLLDLLW